MVVKEVLQMLVESDSKDERMTLVEENMSVFESENEPVDTTELQTTVDGLQKSVEELTLQVDVEKQKYRDTFFGNEEPNEEDEAEKEETKSLDDILSSN